ncbi:hypothetical protein JHK82_043318 [Glycine max]|nr:hypothetical protein JHK82_043318 [Glycine max]
MDLQGAVKDIIAWDGTLSSSDFSLSAHTFSEKWKRFNPSFPPWQWIPCLKHHLVASHKELSWFVSVRWKDTYPWRTCAISNQVRSASNLVYYCILNGGVDVNYWIVVFITGRESDRSLTWKEESNISQREEPFDNAALEHPYLNRPWYKLHPCGTSDWMKLLFNGDSSLNKKDFVIEQYLVSWFSAIGLVVGLKMPLEMLDTVVSNNS